MKTLFLAWQSPEYRARFPIGRLTFDGELYHFTYIQGVYTAQQQARFQPIWAFPDLDKVYESPELFPLFSNRLLRRSRPDYPAFVQWLNIPEHEDEPIALLSRSGGHRATDTFEVFPYPEPDEQGLYNIHFFAHGLRHLPSETYPRIQQLQAGQLLYVARDCQNPYDPHTLLLRTEDLYNVGYCPRYLVSDISNLLDQSPEKLKVLVERVNQPPTPLQFRLLCHLTARWTQGFQPFSNETYQPLAQEELGAIA